MPTSVRTDRTSVEREWTTTSDEALVTMAADDRAAYGVLYDRYLSRVYRYCYCRLNDRERAEDATSVIFARALMGLATCQGPSFRAWLFTIAHNVVVDDWRKSRLTSSLDAAMDLPDPAPGPSDAAEASERSHSLSEALRMLPDDQRQIIELRIAGLTGPEIANLLGRSHDSIRSSQRRALARLRELLGITSDTESENGGDHAS